MILLHLILYIVMAYLVGNVLYLLLFGIAGLFRRQPEYLPVSPKKRFIILIPAYKEDGVILDTVKHAVEQDYKEDCFDVMVIADQLQEETLKSLAQLPVKVLEVSFEKSTKAKAIKAAMTRLPEEVYDLVMILDADNLLGKGCLEKINAASQQGFDMIQLHRTAKNRNTPTAILDAASEEINNHIFRRGHRALGLSSALIGSGMAFRFTDFKTLMTETDIEDNPGEDREIYLELLRQGKVCEYIEDGLVYDEKVQSGRVLEKQRTRWISAQLQYVRRFWLEGFRHTLTHNIHYIDNALQTLLLPRVMLLMVTFVPAFVGLLLLSITNTGLFPGSILWISLFAGCVLSLGVSVFPYISFKEVAVAAKSLPATFFSIFKALLKSRSNQKEFIRTPKEFVQ